MKLIEKLRKPCGRQIGMGDRCIDGYLCTQCEIKAEAADKIEELEEELDNAMAEAWHESQMR